MSYARWSYADVYVYLDVAGYLICHDAGKTGLHHKEAFTTTETDAMVEHLRAHQQSGDEIAESIEGLLAEKTENDEWMSKVADGMCSDCDGSGKCHNCEALKKHCGLRICDAGKCWQCHGAGRFGAGSP